MPCCAFQIFVSLFRKESQCLEYCLKFFSRIHEKNPRLTFGHRQRKLAFDFVKFLGSNTCSTLDTFSPEKESSEGGKKERIRVNSVNVYYDKHKTYSYKPLCGISERILWPCHAKRKRVAAFPSYIQCDSSVSLILKQREEGEGKVEQRERPGNESVAKNRFVFCLFYTSRWYSSSITTFCDPQRSRYAPVSSDLSYRISSRKYCR